MQGLKTNWKQFWLLVLINAFVGAMVGLERTVLPGLAETKFGLSEKTALLSFIVAFGTAKALFNLFTGRLTQSFTRKKILTIGWLAALPVPFLLMYAPDWSWVIAANILLGINQGLAWSTTVIMKIDLVGERNRGLAMGINEFAGYLAVGLAAYMTAGIAARYGYSYFPFLPGVAISILGLLLTIFLVKDTAPFVHAESKTSRVPLLTNLWKQTTFKHHNLGSVTINGLVNNLNDGVVWGLLPLFLLQKGYDLAQVGILAGLYPAVWGLGQLVTGKLGDTHCKKQLITAGMLLQATALLVVAFSGSFYVDLTSVVLLGGGTALVYPNFLTVIAENTHPSQRAQGLSIFRFWRDSGYVIGALLSGVLADAFGFGTTFIVVAGITASAGALAQVRMCCTQKLLWRSRVCIGTY
ncbi:MAG TPA: MFS transporter [Chitinophagaceae bacterium]